MAGKGAVEEIEVAGHTVRLSSPDRVIFPQRGFTKADVFRYYLAVGDGIMRALRDRPTTLQRFPEGIEGEMFFQKRVPQRGVPPWVRTAQIAFPSGRKADELCPADLAHVAWAAQMGTVVFHPWPVRAADTDRPDELRVDLDPQPGTDFADAVTAAGELRGLLDELGVPGWPKTSGGRGVHVYLRIQPRWTFVEVRRATIALARELERRRPELVTTAWWKEERGRRVSVDFNQMARDRTIACAYSLRANARATVSTPVDWDELPEADPDDFHLGTVPARFAERGDPHAGIDDAPWDITPLLEWAERDAADGLGDMPYPPEYPKMPGEPKRVQPSKDRDRPRP
ncbi:MULTISPECIES: non-homologous end-joining DNA ligase [unclassified Micromonospora]|uniref:non-homologous end-joining DNA ligase n=1 Tax=unclassified Micromonospora TaxID=2617518 RepID=UPI001C221857|nr:MULTISPECIES: non-homologous end-joining DNA ligase [unclassified Micromonospora]MBU8859644.1 non-homologous end-joining DNA ligase [Micromonospora sp. WMMB482]MDM4779160.1 non-homologous end-joining DNA ligase [Micromonospora sp. b486]